MPDEELWKYYVLFMKKLEAGEVKGNTWDDFFDYVNIPPENRSDFAVAAILKQVRENYKEEMIEKEENIEQ